MPSRLNAFAAIAVLTAALTACSDTGPVSGPTTSPPESIPGRDSGSVWVADEGSDSLTVIDTGTNAVVATLTGISHPHNVQVGRDAGTVYAVSGGADVVVAIDASTHAVQATAPTGPAPAHVIEAPNGKVYVTNSGDGTVSVYEQGLQPAGQIDLGGMPHGLRAAEDGSVIVVANTDDGTLNLIDPATDEPMGAVPVGTDPAQVAVDADGRYAYAGIAEPPSVVKVDLPARTLAGTVAVPTVPVQLYLTPDDGTVLSANQGTADAPGDTVSMIDTAAMTVRDTVTTGSGPHGVVVDDTGTRAWVTNTYDDTVSVIDVANSAVLATIPTGSAPVGVSYSPQPPSGGEAPTTTLELPAPADDAPPPHHGH